MRGCLSPSSVCRQGHSLLEVQGSLLPKGESRTGPACSEAGGVFGEPGPMEPVLDNEEGATDPTTEAALIPKGGIFAGLSFEEPCGSGAVLSHHTGHAPRASIARVTVRDEGPESAHLGLRG